MSLPRSGHIFISLFGKRLLVGDKSCSRLSVEIHKMRPKLEYFYSLIEIGTHFIWLFLETVLLLQKARLTREDAERSDFHMAQMSSRVIFASPEPKGPSPCPQHPSCSTRGPRAPACQPTPARQSLLCSLPDEDLEFLNERRFSLDSMFSVHSRAGSRTWSLATVVQGVCPQVRGVHRAQCEEPLSFWATCVLAQRL